MRFIKPASGGITLPELSNPATADNIQTGFQAIDGAGTVMVGTHVEAEIPELPELTNPATAGDILDGHDAINSDGNAVTGTMVDRGAVSASLAAGGSYTVPAGYHNGAGVVSAATLASQTAGTAAAGDIASGKRAWVDGVAVDGTYVAPDPGYQYEEIFLARSTPVSTRSVISSFDSIAVAMGVACESISSGSTYDTVVGFFDTYPVLVSTSDNGYGMVSLTNETFISGNTIEFNINASVGWGKMKILIVGQ